MDLLVGSFNQASIYLLQFHPPTVSSLASLHVAKEHPAIGGHSWLSLSATKKHLYCTAWTSQPSIAAYRIRASGRDVQFLNAKHVQSTSGYVCANATHLFSVGGPSGEVFQLEADGAIGDLVQTLDFVTDQGENQSEQRGAVAHGDFGGLRHGAHSVDLSPDGNSIYVADIGRNCIWTYRVTHAKRGIKDPPLKLGTKHISPRPHDGPRHTWPHPSAKVLYSLQEHSAMVDVFTVAENGVTLHHDQGVRIIPADRDCNAYWADEVRYSTGPDARRPKYLYASTRGLEAHTMGYVAVFRLTEEGLIDGEEAIHIWQTPTSGGLANAVEPAPWRDEFGEKEYLAMTDSQEGWIFMLSFDGKVVKEECKVSLGYTDEGKVVGAATAVWL